MSKSDLIKYIDESIVRLEGYVKNFEDKVLRCQEDVQRWENEISNNKASIEELKQARGILEVKGIDRS